MGRVLGDDAPYVCLWSVYTVIGEMCVCVGICVGRVCKFMMILQWDGRVLWALAALFFCLPCTIP
jgi:hypothetical protein